MQLGTAANLMHLLRDSGLFTRDQFRVMVREVSPLGDDLAVVARHLMATDRLTLYQLRKVTHNKTAELFIGPYALCDKLGEGGMGKVYRGRHLRLGRQVALKVVRAKLLANPVIRGRYDREVKAAAALQHPNIVSVFDHGETGDGRCYLVMEFVDGIDLSKVVRDFGRLYIPEACEYVRQASLGLQHAHDSGFVHRDIKPSNILVAGHRHIPAAEGPAVVKILDMGLVRAVGLDDEVNRAEAARDGAVVGTPDYMAPEQARNSNGVDHRADLYSLGATLYFLLTGRPPFPDGSPVEKLLRHISDQPPPVQALRRDVPNSLAQLIARLLAKRPENRVPTAREVAQLLEPYCSYTGGPPADPNPDPVVPPAESVPSADTFAGDKSPAPLFGPESSVMMPVDPRVLTLPDAEREVEKTAEVTALEPFVPATPLDVADCAHPTPPPVAIAPRRQPAVDPAAAAVTVAPAPALAPERRVDRERRRRRLARRPRQWPVVLGTSTVAAVLAAAAVWLGRPDPTPPTPTAAGLPPAPATDPDRPRAGRDPGGRPPLPHRVPHDAGLVLVAHPAEFLRSRVATDRVRQLLDRAAADTGFDLARSDRAVLAATRSRPEGVLAVSEGAYIDAAFADRRGRAPSPAGRPGWYQAAPADRLFALANNPDLLARYAARAGQPGVAPRGVTTDLMDELRAAEDFPLPVLAGAIDGSVKLPGDGRTLKDVGVDFVAARASVGDRLRVEVVLHGPDRQQLADFVPAYARAVREKFPRFAPLADAVEKGGRAFTLDGDRYRLTVTADWSPQEFTYWLEVLLAE